MQYVEQIGYKSEAFSKAKLESIVYYPFHIHENSLEILCVLNGDVKIWDSAATYILSYGDVHIFNCNVPHRIISTDPKSIILTTHISLSHYEYFFKELESARFICDTDSQADDYSMDIKYLRFMLARLYQLYMTENSMAKLEKHTKDLLHLLLTQFQKYIYKENENKTVDIVRLQNLGHVYKSYERMYKIADYVEAHYHEKLSLKKVADMEFLSASHLSRYIKNSMGISFSQLVSITRCHKAAALLSTTEKNVDEIAAEVGFANRNHLTVQFKKWYSKTPSDYRSAILNDLKPDSIIELRPFDYDFAKALLNMYLEEY